MTSVLSSQKPLLGSAAVACSACRRLKMRCVGAADGHPCARCLRTGRRCVVQPSRRGQQQPTSSRGRKQPVLSSLSEPSSHQDDRAATHTAPSSPAARSSMVHPTLDEAYALHDPPSRIETDASPIGFERWESPAPSRLPSLYTSSPMDVLGSLVSQQMSKEISFQHPSPLKTAPIENSRLTDIPQDILVEYIEFFRVKILYCVPVIDNADLRDPIYVIQHKRPLAYCAAFIASQFIPGSTSIRQRLLPHISKFIESTNGSLTSNEDVLWTQLQAFAVLYAYRPAADVYQLPGAVTSPAFLNCWQLKNSIEAFALRAGLHRSIDDLRVLLRSSSPRTSELPAFHKYIYWLWLVTMSHHFSLMTRTPPSIREDSSISSTVDLLRDVPRPARVTRILAEIDLFTLWQRAGRRAPGLAEWWCTPSNTQSVEDLLEVLEDMDGALEVWGQRWGLRGEPQTTISNVDISANGAVDFHFRRMHFCVLTFGTQHILERTQFVLDKEAAPGARLVDAARESILKSVRAAHACSRCLVDIPPLRRETVRYMSEFGYGLIAFCCIYIMQAHKLLGAALPELEKFLTSVEEVATFMSEMAVANNAAPRLYGQTIMRLLRQGNDDTDSAGIDPQSGAGQDGETVGGFPSVTSSLTPSLFVGDHAMLTPSENAVTDDRPRAHLQRASTPSTFRRSSPYLTESGSFS